MDGDGPRSPQPHHVVEATWQVHPAYGGWYVSICGPWRLYPPYTIVQILGGAATARNAIGAKSSACETGDRRVDDRRLIRFTRAILQLTNYIRICGEDPPPLSGIPLNTKRSSK